MKDLKRLDQFMKSLIKRQKMFKRDNKEPR